MFVALGANLAPSVSAARVAPARGGPHIGRAGQRPSSYSPPGVETYCAVRHMDRSEVIQTGVRILGALIAASFVTPSAAARTPDSDSVVEWKVEAGFSPFGALPDPSAAAAE